MSRKVGDVVKIFDDPLTMKKFEAEATLIEMFDETEDEEHWLVEFTRGHERHPRWIKKETDRSYLHPENHHSNGSTFCQRLQYFIDEEEKGVGEYEEFLEKYRPELTMTSGFGFGNTYLVMVNRIVEEQRSHVEILKRIKEAVCP